MIKIILLAYLLLINIITYFTYAADKTKARQNKWRIPQHSRLTGAVCPLFTILQISPQHQPWQSAQADGWSFDNLERLADRNKVHHFP